MSFFGIITERDFRKFHNMGTYTKWSNAALWIFSRKTRSVTVPRFGFFPGFTDKGFKALKQNHQLRILEPMDLNRVRKRIDQGVIRNSLSLQEQFHYQFFMITFTGRSIFAPKIRHCTLYIVKVHDKYKFLKSKKSLKTFF